MKYKAGPKKQRRLTVARRGAVKSPRDREVARLRRIHQQFVDANVRMEQRRLRLVLQPLKRPGSEEELRRLLELVGRDRAPTPTAVAITPQAAVPAVGENRDPIQIIPPKTPPFGFQGIPDNFLPDGTRQGAVVKNVQGAIGGLYTQPDAYNVVIEHAFGPEGVFSFGLLVSEDFGAPARPLGLSATLNGPLTIPAVGTQCTLQVTAVLEVPTNPGVPIGPDILFRFHPGDGTASGCILGSLTASTDSGSGQGMAKVLEETYIKFQPDPTTIVWQFNLPLRISAWVPLGPSDQVVRIILTMTALASRTGGVSWALVHCNSAQDPSFWYPWNIYGGFPITLSTIEFACLPYSVRPWIPPTL